MTQDVRQLLQRAVDVPEPTDPVSRIVNALNGIRLELAALVSVQRRQTACVKELVGSLVAEYEYLMGDDDDDTV